MHAAQLWPLLFESITLSVTSRLAKGLRLLSRPRFAYSAARYGVAAAIEHVSAIKLTAPATLLDVGANKGQFSLAFRQLRPEGRVIAFEPLAEAADTFSRLFGGDSRVTLHPFALSDADGSAEFHVTDRADSSSLLPPGQGQARAFGVNEELRIEVPIRRLDSVVTICDLARPVLLKIDVQGAELSVIAGCADLTGVDYIYSELSFVELYEGQPLFDESAQALADRGYRLAGVFNQVSTPEFGPTQADFLFKRVD